jgi:cytidine deaminase
MQVSDKVQKVYQETLKARTNAYAPFSNFQVGAVFAMKDSNDLYPGCNVENLSFGATVCAERSAILGMISRHGKDITKQVEFLVVVANTDPVTVPCALCLQVLVEFFPKDFPIYLGNLKGLHKKLALGDLLPMPFDTLDKKGL